MPKVSPQYRSRRRQEILDAALACLAKDGLRRTTMQDIVQRSELSPGAIYRYFQSKDQMVEQIARERHAWERDLIAKRSRDPDALAALCAIVHDFAESLSSERGRKMRRMGVELWAEALHDRRLKKLVQEGVHGPLTLIAELVERARKSGQLSSRIEPEPTARALIALFHGFILQKSWEPDLDPAPLVEATLALLAPPSAAVSD
jgi:AcrR family transcriptional regulator